MRIPINEASAAQLREFAAVHLGIETHQNWSAATLAAKIREAYDKDDIEVAEAGPRIEQTGPSPRPVTADQMGPAPDYVRLIIQVQDGAGGNDPVPLGCNGSVMLVPRGREVDIPVKFFESLRHAVEARYDVLEDGSMNPVPRQVTLYPYQVVAAGAKAREVLAA